MGVLTAAGLPFLGRVWASAEASSLRVIGARMVLLADSDAAAAGEQLGAGRPLGGAPCVALQLLGEGVVEKLAALVAHLEGAEGLPAGALRAAASPAGAAALAKALLGPAAGRAPSARASCAKVAGAACVLVLPHALLGGSAGAILSDCTAALAAGGGGGGGGSGGEGGLAVTALKILEFSRGQAEEFLEVYKDVVPEYVVRRGAAGRGAARRRPFSPRSRPNALFSPPRPLQDLVNEYSSGPMIALEVSGEGAVETVRAIAGPRDVEVARRVRPHTMRAKHGVAAAAGGPGARARLAVHTTDLAEDGPLEADYVFNLVD